MRGGEGWMKGGRVAPINQARPQENLCIVHTPLLQIVTVIPSRHGFKLSLLDFHHKSRADLRSYDLIQLNQLGINHQCHMDTTVLDSELFTSL